MQSIYKFKLNMPILLKILNYYLKYGMYSLTLKLVSLNAFSFSIEDNGVGWGGEALFVVC